MTDDRNKKDALWTKYTPVVTCALSFIIGSSVNAFKLFSTVATIPYVDQKVTEQKLYTDQKTAEILKEAFEHSDTNRLLMEKSIEAQTSLIREQSSILSQVKDWLQRLSDRVTLISDRDTAYQRRGARQ